MTGRTALIFLSLSLVACFLFGQEEEEQEASKIEDAINGMVNSHPIKLSIFRVQPKFVAGSTYDTNSLSNPVGLEVEDYYFSLVPGGSVATLFGDRAYASVDYDVAFNYHREIEALRTVVQYTSLNFTTGSDRVLVSVSGGFSNPKARVSVEYDEPVQQHKRNVGGNLIYGIRPRTDLNLFVSRTTTTFDDTPDLPTTLAIPADTLTFRYGGGVDHTLNDSVRLSFDGRLGYYRTLGSNQFSRRDFWDVFPGFIFTGDKLTGTARAGFGKTEKSEEQGTLNDFLLLVDIDYRTGGRWILGGSASRTRQISDLITDSFRVAVEGGLRATVVINDSLSLTFSGRVGKNDYGENFYLDLGPITKDNFYTVGPSLDIQLPADFVLSLGADYLNRESNIPDLTKKRFVLRLGLVLQGS